MTVTVMMQLPGTVLLTLETALQQLWHTRYSSPSILQPSILRPPMIIRPLDLVPKGNFLSNDLYFKTTCHIRPHLLGPMGGLKIEGPLYV